MYDAAQIRVWVRTHLMLVLAIYLAMDGEGPYTAVYYDACCMRLDIRIDRSWSTPSRASVHTSHNQTVGWTALNTDCLCCSDDEACDDRRLSLSSLKAYVEFLEPRPVASFFMIR